MRRVSPQKSDAVDKNENEESEQAKFNHGGVKDTDGTRG
jgi:hypothetical protein